MMKIEAQGRVYSIIKLGPRQNKSTVDEIITASRLRPLSPDDYASALWLSIEATATAIASVSDNDSDKYFITVYDMAGHFINARIATKEAIEDEYHIDMSG